jgi:hypothetical protein
MLVVVTMYRRSNPLAFVVGIIITVGVHAAVVAVALWSRAGASEKPPSVGTFVDAQLVRFGKPRDLSFLPHKSGVVKNNVKPDAIKIAKDEKELPRLDKKPEPDKYDPLKKTHAELFKSLKDPDQPEAVEDQTGSQTGSRAGTATEAKGDPYIQAIVDAIGSQWQVPTTIKDEQLANLSADVCFFIGDDGTLQRYAFERKSGNSQFDSSLDAALSTVKMLPAPPDRWKHHKFCPTLSKQ